MTTNNIYNLLDELNAEYSGEIYMDEATRLLYATDASAYREVPMAVALPKNRQDILHLIQFANKHKIGIIPRTAGTSLAGQVVGNGIIVDVSRYFNRILKLNIEEKWVKVEPGVVLDELNFLLKPYGLFFGPETSTSNRCMIGGMLGNNSCGAHSLVYGSVRDHTLAVKAFLSDGSEVEFTELDNNTFHEKCEGSTLENAIYRNIRDILSNPENQKEIRAQYPDASIHRRNTGYAIDLLLDTAPFTPEAPKFNFSKLIAGSEGTLAFVTEITLNLVSLPPKETGLVCVHVNSVNEALLGNLIALQYQPVAVELMDKVIMDCTLSNIEQRKNRFFIQGDPGAILIVEFTADSIEEIQKKAQELESKMRAEGIGYHFPLVTGGDVKKVWNLRKAGLGLLSNVPGDAKPVPVIEDTAVKPEDLPQYIDDFQKILEQYGLSCVYYAHIGTGELHLRPVLNLKDPKDVELFHTIAYEIALLVKKYKGSLSGEHGDGRLRGEFIPIMIGEKCYSLLKEIKKCWDPNNIFNPGKITDTPPMNSFLRFIPGQPTPEISTFYDFSAERGIIRAAEQCNGSADCRKSELIGGTMCPSFMATRDEHNTTRARANMLREMLSRKNATEPFDSKELYEVMDLCLMCKGCKAECPSNVDITKYKSEFLQHYYDKHGIPIRTKLIAYIEKINRLGAIWPAVYNFFVSNAFFSKLIKKLTGFATQRSMPLLHKTTLKRWYKKNKNVLHSLPSSNGKVYLFADEFTNYNDTPTGIAAIQLLTSLGYRVEIPEHALSGRTFMSKGLLRTAAKIANKNVELLCNLISDETPLIGIEPSAILSFRDEFPLLCRGENQEKAKKMAPNCLMFDEFFMQEVKKGKISSESFSKEEKNIRLHGHCHQKALASTGPTKEMLQVPVNFHVDEIKSGCCGMAGGFGFEKEHYSVSMAVGELILFPEIRKSQEGTIIAAPGTSCRHQILDGTGVKAWHPVEIMYEALIKKIQQ